MEGREYYSNCEVDQTSQVCVVRTYCISVRWLASLTTHEMATTFGTLSSISPCLPNLPICIVMLIVSASPSSV